MSARPSTSPVSRRTTLENGTVVVEARWRAIAGAWLLDCLVLSAPAGAASGAVVAGTSDAGAAVAVWLVVWPVAAMLYGFATAHRRSLGQLAAGTRTVRHTDGTVPGFWRAGWVMVVRTVLLPPALVVSVVGIFTGGGDLGGETRHLSVDTRATEALRAARARREAQVQPQKAPPR